MTVQSDSFSARNLSDFTIYLQQAYKALLTAIAIILQLYEQVFEASSFLAEKNTNSSTIALFEN
ncbi:MAG TPA: hypothetical protein IGS53_09035 [Leptolyngbyaceae cyanobacterium M33_DOE_097]|uniref:Uncharacterized protein n=1 Tax=Oscillatoriales cyanobacterium SpSt-418 TaxID=2282169 RepID=A0A7C3KDJ3_9CYAN|nr:hypothetical protein [Leptolyngbyaceae cyanobacterium M33_DOE_097]